MKRKTILICLLLSFSSTSFATYMDCHSDCGDEEPCCCYVPEVQYRQESFDVPECCLIPELKYRRKKRYTLKHYKQKFITYVPKVIEKTIAKYEPEYYYEAYYQYHKCASKTRCCASVPYTVYKKVNMPKCDAEAACCQ